MIHNDNNVPKGKGKIFIQYLNYSVKKISETVTEPTKSVFYRLVLPNSYTRIKKESEII